MPRRKSLKIQQHQASASSRPKARSSEVPGHLLRRCPGRLRRLQRACEPRTNYSCHCSIPRQRLFVQHSCHCRSDRKYRLRRHRVEFLRTSLRHGMQMLGRQPIEQRKGDLEHRYHIPRLSGAELRPQYTKSSMISGTTLHTSISRSHMNFGNSLGGVMLWAQRRRAALRTRRV